MFNKWPYPVVLTVPPALYPPSVYKFCRRLPPTAIFSPAPDNVHTQLLTPIIEGRDIQHHHTVAGH